MNRRDFIKSAFLFASALAVPNLAVKAFTPPTAPIKILSIKQFDSILKEFYAPIFEHQFTTQRVLMGMIERGRKSAPEGKRIYAPIHFNLGDK